MTTQPTVRDYMTPSPHTISVDRSLTDAHSLMRQFHIRHLPVVEGGRLVGIVSERDLHLVETFKDVTPADVQVEEAMTADPYVVSPETPLQEVAATMWKKKFGSAVVVDGREVVGVFTTIDALGALITALARESSPRRVRRPTEKADRKPV